ncbi:putative terminase large subunit [Vibrio phage 489E54-1]|nr:putative terminase large subunit [Vibrio phage 489E54-1]
MALVIDCDKYGVTQEYVKQFEYPGLRPLVQDWRWCHKYAHDILTGLVPSCKKMKWAALRHFKDMQRDDIYFDEEAADEIVRWFKFCPIVKGPKSGQPTVLDPSQIFIAASLMAWKWSYDVFEVDDDTGQEIQVRHAHKRRYNQIYAQVSRKYGKALSLDTVIPTPSGWSTMGDLQVGDVVFDENGKPCNVTGVTDIQYNRTCYEVVFSNGEKVIADADHQWFTKARSDNDVGSVKTTQQIFETMTYGLRGDRNHHLDMPEALECGEVDLPVDPYLLGYWLGDGAKENSSVTCGLQDIFHFYDELNKIGFKWKTIETRPKVYRVTPVNCIYGKPVNHKSEFNLTKVLNDLGVRGDKHVPEVYKRASYEQRLSLVQGLMDSDGTINKRGNQLVFNQNEGKVFDDFCELIASLGIKYTVREKYNSKFDSWSRECTFNTSRSEHPVFRLKRKLERMSVTAGPRSKTVSIVSCELVESVPVKCISVDSPNRLYRFGKSMLPTHNTTFTAGIKLYLMRKYKYGPRIFSLATKREQAKEVWGVAKKMIKLSPQLRRFFDARANEILSPKNEGEFKALASDSNSLDGLDPIAACLDECHAIKDRNLYGVLISAFGSNEGGEYLFSVITTAGFILQGLCTDLYKNGSAVLDPDNEAEQDNYFYVIFEIDQGDDWTDQKSWYKSNPGMVYGRPSLQYMRDRLKEATMSTEEKANFLTKHCNLFVNGSDKWLDMDLVRACEIPLEKLNSRIEGYQREGRKGYAAIDRARVNDICSSVMLYPDDDGGITLKFLNFISQKGYDGAGDYLKEVYRKAKESGDLVVLRTNSVRDEDLEEHIIEWFNEYNIEAFHYDPWHMRQICENMEDKGYNMVAVSQGTGNMSEPAKNLEGLFEEGLVRFHSRLFEYACECALMGMTRKNNVEVFRDPKAWKIDKIDPLIATIIALSGATLIKIDKNVYEDRGLFSV